MKTIALTKQQKQFKLVFVLALATIAYNLAEGLVATYFGIKDETLTLLGFGGDSFIETISALGVAQMVYRIWRHPHSEKGPFEISALKITGWCFYALALILLISSGLSLQQGHQPISTIAGVIIAGISIFTMWALVAAKMALGKSLGSAAVIADARCNMVCIYMSVVLLLSSGLWWLFHIPYVDVLGSLSLVYFSIKEGREALEKAKGIACCED